MCFSLCCACILSEGRFVKFRTWKEVMRLKTRAKYMSSGVVLSFAPASCPCFITHFRMGHPMKRREEETGASSP